MVTISTEAQPDKGAVVLTIGTLAALASLVRHDSNGLADVRTMPGVIPGPANLVTTRTNLCTTPSFEGTTGDWSHGPGVTATVSTAQASSGSRSLAITRVNTTPATGWVNTAFPVTAGQTYPVSFDVRGGAGTYGYKITGPDGAVVSGTFNAPGAAWARKTLTYTAATTGTAAFQVNDDPAPSPASGTTLYLDAVLIGDAGAYFDGDTPDTATVLYSWTDPLGLPNRSSSIAQAQDGPLEITDYEAAHGPVTYTLTDVNGATATVSLDFALETPWLFSPILPGYSRPLSQVSTITGTRPTNSTVHSGLLGRPDPIVVMRPQGLRTGTLTAWAGTYAAALDLLSVLDRAVVLMLRQADHAGLDMYFCGSDAAVVALTTDGPATVWGVSLDYVEVKRPLGDLAGTLGWTYADLAAAAATYADLPRLFATYADMRLNVRTS